MKRISAQEAIASVLGWDIRDVSDGRYQAGRTSIPVYVCGENYFCAPTANQKPPREWTWTLRGQFKGKDVYEATGAAPD